MRSILCAALLSLMTTPFACVTTAFADEDDVAVAALKRAIVEAHCPPVRKGSAEKAAKCYASRASQDTVQSEQQSLENGA